MISHALGLFGGSFDPVHNGHLLLARDALEQLGLDKIIFLPAKISPHKLDRPPSLPEARVALLEAALRGEDRFSLDAREIRREGPSFTIDTLREYRTEFPGVRLFYFIGEDNLEGLSTWKDFEELERLAQFVVLARSATTPDTGHPVIRRVVEISSTEIRKRVARGLPIRYMTPMSVCEEIQKRGLYRHD